jgi:hypothetical protein
VLRNTRDKGAGEDKRMDGEIRKNKRGNMNRRPKRVRR